MLKNISFLLACVLITGLAWGFLRFFGHYSFLIMSVITVALLVSRLKTARFGDKS